MGEKEQLIKEIVKLLPDATVNVLEFVYWYIKNMLR